MFLIQCWDFECNSNPPRQEFLTQPSAVWHDAIQLYSRERYVDSWLYSYDYSKTCGCSIKFILFASKDKHLGAANVSLFGMFS